MAERNDDKTRKAEPSPIIDGDARPDINLNPEDERDHPIPTPHDTDKANTTHSRKDKNSLEDFRDAKQE